MADDSGIERLEDQYYTLRTLVLALIIIVTLLLGTLINKGVLRSISDLWHPEAASG